MKKKGVVKVKGVKNVSNRDYIHKISDLCNVFNNHHAFNQIMNKKKLILVFRISVMDSGLPHGLKKVTYPPGARLARSVT